jgi:outer membrane protein TolC
VAPAIAVAVEAPRAQESAPSPERYEQPPPVQSPTPPSTQRAVSGDSPNRLDLTAAIAYAVKNSPELESQELEVDLSETDLRRAWGLIQPKIAFQHTSTKVDKNTVEYYNRLPDGANLLLGELGFPPIVPPFVFEESHLSQVVMTQNLFSGGANRFRISGAKAHRNATRAARDDRKAQILMLVQRAFFDLTRQWEVVGLRRESLARAERSLESVQRRFSLGLVPRAEVLRWKVQVSGERVLLIEARNSYDVGLEHFKRLIGYPPHAHLDLVFPSDAEVAGMMEEGIAALELDRADVSGAWLEEHPAIRAAAAEADAARLARRAASSDFWPTLDLDGSYGYLENDTLELDEFDQWSARLRLNFSLWDGGARVQNRAEARTMEDLAEVQLRVVRDELFVNDRAVVADLRADLAALEEARAAVEQARETLESVSNKAALGLADYIQRIDAQVILIQSEVAETSARYQFVIDLVRWWRIRDPERLLTGIAQ